MASNDIVPAGGFLPALFGQGRAAERQHQAQLAQMGRRAERAQEAVSLVNETGREAITEVYVSGLARQQATQLDPAGAAVYAEMWAQTAQDTQYIVHKLARRLR